MTTIDIDAGKAATVAKKLRAIADDIVSEFGGTYRDALREAADLVDPLPPRPVGSCWVDPETRAEYIQTDGVGKLIRYRSGTGATDGVLLVGVRTNDEVIARLVPVPCRAGDPA